MGVKDEEFPRHNLMVQNTQDKHTHKRIEMHAIMMMRKRFSPTTRDPSSAPNASLLWPTTLVVNQARRRGDSRNRANAGEGGQGHQGAGGGGASLQDDPPVPAVLPCSERNVKLSHAVEFWRGALGMMYRRMRLGLQFGVLDAPATHVNM